MQSPGLTNSFRLDRTAFRIQTHTEAAHQRTWWLSRSAAERLSAAWYLTCAAYNIPYHGQHRLDRTVFSARKQPA
ncbi:MAG: hypothetical protein LH618_18915 [Saprospiraceae bacterium]|nr:hypothetical protein [Saprospiraceae bacterium]